MRRRRVAKDLLRRLHQQLSRWAVYRPLDQLRTYLLERALHMRTAGFLRNWPREEQSLREKRRAGVRDERMHTVAGEPATRRESRGHGMRQGIGMAVPHPGTSDMDVQLDVVPMRAVRRHRRRPGARGTGCSQGPPGSRRRRERPGSRSKWIASCTRSPGTGRALGA